MPRLAIDLSTRLGFGVSTEQAKAACRELPRCGQCTSDGSFFVPFFSERRGSGPFSSFLLFLTRHKQLSFLSSKVRGGAVVVFEEVAGRALIGSSKECFTLRGGSDCQQNSLSSCVLLVVTDAAVLHHSSDLGFFRFTHALSKPHHTTGERLSSDELVDACISSFSANPAAAGGPAGPPGGVGEGRGGGGGKTAAAAAEGDGARGSGGKTQASSPPPPPRSPLAEGPRREETTLPRIPDSVIAKVCRPIHSFLLHQCHRTAVFVHHFPP